MLAPFKDPDYSEMSRISKDAQALDLEIGTMEARLFLTDDFDELLRREIALGKLYDERRKIGDELIAASKYRRERG